MMDSPSPYNMSSPPPDEFDSELADELHKHAIRQLHERMEFQLKLECDKHDKPLREALETIQSTVEGFERRKRVLYATMRKVEGDDRARQVIQSLDQQPVYPPSFQELVKYLLDKQQTNAGSSLATPATTPIVESRLVVAEPTPRQATANITASRPAPDNAPPSASGSDRPGQSSTGTGTGTPTPAPKQVLTAKRSRPPVDTSTPQRKKHKSTSPSKADTSSTQTEQLVSREAPLREVEGQEYIFKYPDNGNRFYVLRCNRGLFTPEYTFATHPFQPTEFHDRGPAYSHFNYDKTCKGDNHDHSRQYTANEIVKEFGYNVSGPDVNDEWVQRANARLQAEIAKYNKAKSRKTGHPEIGVANRP